MGREGGREAERGRREREREREGGEREREREREGEIHEGQLSMHPRVYKYVHNRKCRNFHDILNLVEHFYTGQRQN